jgi:hypothetical protein
MAVPEIGHLLSALLNLPSTRWYWPPRLTIFNGGVTEGCEVEPGADEESLEGAWLVLHPSEPGSGQRGQ